MIDCINDHAVEPVKYCINAQTVGTVIDCTNLNGNSNRLHQCWVEPRIDCINAE